MKTQVWMCPPGADDGTRMLGLLSAVGPFQFPRKAGNLSPERVVHRKLAGGPGPSEPSVDHPDESPGKPIPRELSLGREQLLLGGDWPEARQPERSLLSPLRLVPDPADQAGHHLPGPRHPPRPSPPAPPQISILDNACGLTKLSPSWPPAPSLTLPPPGMVTTPASAGIPSPSGHTVPRISKEESSLPEVTESTLDPQGCAGQRRERIPAPVF